MPAVTVELAFGSVWSDDPAGFTWTDVSSYVKKMESLESNRGRSTELDLFSAGQASFLLDSPARRFDPLNADGPYYGNLLPGVPVRITAESEPLFYGYIDSWKHLPGTKLSTVAVTATDAFRFFAGLPLRSAYEYEVLSDSPEVYFVLDGADPSNVLVDSSGNGHDGLYSTAVADGGAIRPLAQGSAKADPPDIQIGRSPHVVSDLDPITVELWFKGPATYDLPNPLAYVRTESPSVSSQQWFSFWSYPPPTISGVGGEVVVRFGFHPDSFLFYANLQDGLPHHVVMVFDSTAAPITDGLTITPREVIVYVDGVEASLYRTQADGLFPTTGRPQGITLGAVPQLSADNLLEAAISDVAFYPGVTFTAADVARHYQTALRPWDGDTTGARIERILDLIGWPASLRDIDPGETSCGNADTAGSTVLDYLQTLAETEGGRLFVAADGKVTFHDASRTINGTSQYTFTDGGTGTGILVGGLTFSLDDVFLYDGAEVQRRYGTIQRAGASTPTRIFSKTDLLFRTDAQARSLAERIAFRYGTAQTRAEAFEVSLNQHNTADWPDVLALEIGDVVTVTLTPQGAGDPLSLNLFLEQVTHRSSGGSWRSTFYGSPVDPADYLVCDTTDPDEYLESGVCR
jgi:hypothetical protein